MKKNSVVGYFYGHENKYYILGNYYYWFMGQHDNMAVDLINRTTVDNIAMAHIIIRVNRKKRLMKYLELRKSGSVPVHTRFEFRE